VPAPAISTAAAAGDGDPSPLPVLTEVLSPAPTLLPSLAFHDIVFGHELGAGAFSLVRFAKRIVRGVPGSAWPPLAVKIVSTRTLAALGYEASVRREMAVLAALTHPNVARLISAFRWRDGAYLALEFAPGGDLHTLLSRQPGGRLALEPARFLLGELTAAVAHVHGRGFAYGDIKPENVLLAPDASGGLHVKLTDFGAARPITAAGAALLARSGRILADLRDGDWRAARGLGTAAADAGLAPGEPPAEASRAAGEEVAVGSTEAAVAAEAAAEPEPEDERLEGTEEYLAPELASRTGRPSVASDAYALGVTTFQALAGALPDASLFWPQQLTPLAGAEPRHVRFRDAGAAQVAAAAGGAADGFPAGFPAEAHARAFVRGLLHPDPAQRLGGGPRGFEEFAEHPFLAPLLAMPALQRLAAAAAAAPAAEAYPGPHSHGGSGSGGSACAALSLLYRLRSPLLQPVEGDAAGAPADAGWARRRNSTIWAPLPRSYLLQAAASGLALESDAAAAAALSGEAVPPAAATLRELLALPALPALEPR